MSFTSISGIQINNQIIKPSGRGNTLYVGGSGEGNYTTIQSAIDDAFNGDTVFVFNGNYHENLKIYKSLELKGEDKYNTVIDGDGTGVIISANGVCISGFKIINGNGGHCGIRINSNNNIISGNIISDNSDGIDFDDSSTDNNFIMNNVISKNALTGIDLWFSDNCKISGNYISKNGWDGIYISYSNKNRIYSNVISNNGQSGVDLHRSSENSIYKNSIIINNLFGIKLTFCDENSIYKNNFILNIPKNAGFMWSIINPNVTPFNLWDKNYWNNPRILPKAILGWKGEFGCIPCFNFDWNPAKVPNNITTTQGCGIE